MRMLDIFVIVALNKLLRRKASQELLPLYSGLNKLALFIALEIKRRG